MSGRQVPDAPSRVEPLPHGLVDGLAEPSAYPFDPHASAGVSAVQTHISHVFLTKSHVYKLRKAVDFGFLNFATRQVRNEDCLREMALNRRLAADVYLGVAAVRVDAEGVRMGPVAETISSPELEHCVVMRRLPEGLDGLSLLQRGALTEAHLDVVADAMVGFHQGHRLGRPAPFTPEEWIAAITGPVEDNFVPIAGVIGEQDVAGLARATRTFVETHRESFERRRREGRAVDAHGDLHLAHVWFDREATPPPTPQFIDCIEFSERLRHIDAASEVAFLAMDLRYRGRSDLAERFLSRYASGSNDFHLYTVVDFFLSYRAGVRAKVAALAAGEPEVPTGQRQAARESARRHLDLAREALEPHGEGAVVMMTGVVGTGKSTAAAVVADALGPAVVIASDRVRKHLAGLQIATRAGDAVDAGIYSPTFTERTYAALVEHAHGVCESGRTAILDATFSTTEQRAQVADFARQLKARLLVVETRCSREDALARLRRREEGDADPSDAGPDFYQTSVDRFAPVRVPDGAGHVVVDTGHSRWRASLVDEIRTWAAHSSQGSPGRPK